MWQPEDALEGRLCAGRSHGGRQDLFLELRLSERSVYQLQRVLEETAIKSENPFEVRGCVLLGEELRLAVALWQEHERHEALVGN